MAQLPNRAAEMAVFVRVVEAGGFAGAARSLGLSPSAVSKLVTRLERRLGARLLRRSTRHVAMTPEGEAFHARAQSILAEIDAAEREAGGAALPAGRLRVNTSASYVAHVLAALLPDFLARYPDIDLDIVQTDAIADLVADRSDIAIRAGTLLDSALVSRSLGDTLLIVVAAPTWIARHGEARTFDELAAAGMLGFAYRRASGTWLPPAGAVPERVRVSDGEGIRQLALAGVAPARLAKFTIRDDLAAGRLIPLLADLAQPTTEPFHAVYVGRSDTLPARARVFLDFIAEEGRVN